MWRTVKIVIVALTSLLVLILLAASLALWLIFTPQRLTPIVQNQADKYLSCQSHFGNVELTFFRTFPQLGLKISDCTLQNPMPGASTDTLLSAQQMLLTVDVNAWRQKREIRINELSLAHASINVFADSLGNANYLIYNSSANTTTVNDTTSEQASTPPLTIDNIDIKNTNIAYINQSSKLDARVQSLDANLSATMEQNTIRSAVHIHKSFVSLAQNCENYLDNTPIEFQMLSDIALDKQQILIDNLQAVIDVLDMQLSGSLSYQADSSSLYMNLSFVLNETPVAPLLKLVPPSLQHYTKSIDADGLLASAGSITGQFNPNEMPTVDLSIDLENGTLTYHDFPLQLHDIFGRVTFKSDLRTDASTILNIDHFEAKTPLSEISTSGTVTQLFSDMHLMLNTQAKLTLEEFKPFIPDSLKTEVNGKAEAQIESQFTLSQLKNTDLEKMKLSAYITLSHFDAVYDSLALASSHSNIHFALPNPNRQTENTGFAVLSITSADLSASMIDKFEGQMQNSVVRVEISDFRDTTRLPDVLCSFRIDSLTGSTDTLGIALAHPLGQFKLNPMPYNTEIADIELRLSTASTSGNMGKTLARLASMELETKLEYSSREKEIWEQWQARGSFHLEQAELWSEGLDWPVEIPSIKLNFEPEALAIEESRFILDESDFQLSGELNNISSYFRNDSILRGNFDFTSETTNVSQLMNLTSGIGYNDEETDTQAADTTSTGPYMVPKGIDIALNTRVENASFGTDSASNIKGVVRISDGILLLDEMRLETPAARMQLTAMYRTPRKNHLFMGLDYHLLDVEISELLMMIPEVDSLMPMLRSFGGKGEFHIAAETYLDSSYNLKMSTLRGAASLAGQDLVLMDGETFSEIAKTLRFSKKAENKVDSLSAEFTIFRNEIDVYPFVVVMDRYKAIVTGRHNFDMSFDYHISLIDSPLPLKLGVDVRGVIGDMAVRPAQPRYAESYRPANRFAVSNMQLELRKSIRETLTREIEW
ncbi:MAG: AsmA family protein [Prolixibacteraceae bacterium]|nr:AsmA family protein [Prolixibacteraceae bacterium]MBN2649623.1 AsmA family protein [Prolixibacteraceae bacterium]